MTINEKTKDIKHEQAWLDNIKTLAFVLEKTQKEELTKKLEKRVELNNEIKTIQTEITSLESKKKSLKNVVANHRGASEKLSELNDNYTTGTKSKMPNKFLNGGTNEYN